MKAIGEFELIGSSLLVSDPICTPGSVRTARVEGCVSGQWIGSIDVNDAGMIKYLCAQRKDTPIVKYVTTRSTVIYSTEALGIFDAGRFSAKLITPVLVPDLHWEELEKIAIYDKTALEQHGVFVPEHINIRELMANAPPLYTSSLYEVSRDIIGSPDKAGLTETGVLCLAGNGLYHVSIGLDDRGSTVAVALKFI